MTREIDMEIKEQENTYQGFGKWMTRGTIACILVLAFLAAFVA
jgi:hypothetical protein